MIVTPLLKIVICGVVSVRSRAVSHDRSEPTNQLHFYRLLFTATSSDLIISILYLDYFLIDGSFHRVIDSSLVIPGTVHSREAIIDLLIFNYSQVLSSGLIPLSGFRPRALSLLLLFNLNWENCCILTRNTTLKKLFAPFHH